VKTQGLAETPKRFYGSRTNPPEEILSTEGGEVCHMISIRKVLDKT